MTYIGGDDLLKVHAPGMAHAGAVVITGAMAAGKSTIAQRLAERLPRAVHVHGDAFRRMIASGRGAVDPPLGEAARTHWLDTSGLTVERVLSELPAARIDVPV